MKRILSIVLVVMMMVAMIPLQAFAEEVFTVDYNLTNVTTTTVQSTVTSGSAISVVIEADVGYELPDAVTVNGIYDELNYDMGTGSLEVANIQSNIEIVAEGIEVIPEETPIETGTVVVRYEDENGNELLPDDTYLDLELGEHTFNAPIIEGYTADFNSETIIIEEDGQTHYIIFTYTVDVVEEEPVEEPIIEEPIGNEENTKLNIIGISCLDERNIVIDECDFLFENTENFNGGTMIEIPLMQGELQFKDMYEEDWDYDLEDYFEIDRNDINAEYIVESAEPKELTLYAIYSTPKAPQIKIVYADCSDLNYKDKEDLAEFGNRNANGEHNVMKEEFYDLAVGENIMDIPFIYNELEWTLIGNIDWDSKLSYERIEDKQGNNVGIKVIVPYLVDLELFVGYTLPEVEEEPVIQEPVEEDRPRRENSTPKVEEIPIFLKDIPQEDFVARYLNHKVINEEFKKSSKNNVEFEVDKTLLNELLGDDLTPRIYRWNEEKQKLIAENTRFEIKQGTDNIYTLTSGTDRLDETTKEEYYTIIGVKQPNFKDVETFDYYIDKANGLGLIEGIETDGVLNFEADKQITKSEYYTIIARLMGAVVEGETKMYNILDLKSTEEAEQILEGLELEIADWSKPYVAGLYEKGYITKEDLLENGNQITMNSAMRTLNKVLSEVEDTDDLVEDMNFEQDEFCTRYKMAETLVDKLVEKGW